MSSILKMKDVHRGEIRIDIAAGGILVCDIDGTIADLEHRRAYVRTKPKNWKAFKGGYLRDKPIQWVIDAVKKLHAAGWKVLIATGREGDAQGREDTLLWLEKHNVPFHRFYQRAAKDYRPDDEVKQDILDEMTADYHRPTLAFDDRNRVVDMWRRNGVLCVQTAEGNF